MKHTPGPWEWEEGQPRVHKEWNDTLMPIAEVIKPAWHEDDSKASLEAGDNAKLIAAAPELLEALEDLYAVVRGESNWLLNEDSGGDAVLDEKIRNAIEKATGEKR